MQVPILKTLQKIPGGLMIVPLLIGVMLNTFAPQALDIGGFTTHLFRGGAMPLIAFFVLCHGSQINIKQAGVPVYKGITYTLLKFSVGALIGWTVGRLFGPAGVLGLTPLALVGAMTNSNGGLFVALTGKYGDSTDTGAISILSLTDGPFFTMLGLGLAGIADIPVMQLVAVLVPIFIGFILGNLDDDMRALLKHGTVVPIPFFAFALGAGLNFQNIIDAGFSGVLLGLMTVLIVGTVGFLASRLFGNFRAAGAAIGTTAGNAAMTPAALVAADPSLLPFLEVATVQIATSVIITAVFCPIYVDWLDKRMKAKYGKDYIKIEEEEATV
jgi:2-keto-3-deoxygluconate permease